MVSIKASFNKLFKGIGSAVKKISRSIKRGREQAEKERRAFERLNRQMARKIRKAEEERIRDLHKKYKEDYKKAEAERKAAEEKLTDRVKRINQQARERRKRQLQEQLKKRQQTPPPAPVTVIPTETDMIWQGIMDAINQAYMGGMSSNMPFFSAKGGKISGDARRLTETNSTRIEEIFNKGLSDVMRRHPEFSEQAAKKAIIDALGNYFGNPELIAYHIERIVYGMYDEEYARWGRRKWSDTVSEIKSVINGI